MNIKRKNFFSEEMIKNFEEKYNVKYVGAFCIKNGEEWRKSPSAIFYQENPDVKKGHSNYIALSYKYITEEDIGWFISDGSSAFSEPIVGVVANDGQVIYSAFRHDYEASDDGSVIIDGGRDYTRHTSDAELVELEVVGSEIKIKENGK